ncbi:MAG: hypothetical protein H0V21_10020 [Rubrobacter sp.]|nr:hypothetical protein [Rubrobacter sp.]
MAFRRHRGTLSSIEDDIVASRAAGQASRMPKPRLRPKRPGSLPIGRSHRYFR